MAAGGKKLIYDLCEGAEDFFYNSKYSDVELTLIDSETEKEITMNLHKVMLSRRSKYFQCLFARQSNDNKIKLVVDDIDIIYNIIKDIYCCSLIIYCQHNNITPDLYDYLRKYLIKCCRYEYGLKFLAINFDLHNLLSGIKIDNIVKFTQFVIENKLQPLSEHNHIKLLTSDILRIFVTGNWTNYFTKKGVTNLYSYNEKMLNEVELHTCKEILNLFAGKENLLTITKSGVIRMYEFNKIRCYCIKIFDLKKDTINITGNFEITYATIYNDYYDFANDNNSETPIMEIHLKNTNSANDTNGANDTIVLLNLKNVKCLCTRKTNKIKNNNTHMIKTTAGIYNFINNLLYFHPEPNFYQMPHNCNTCLHCIELIPEDNTIAIMPIKNYIYNTIKKVLHCREILENISV